jgi:hypothetical protein
MCRRALWKEFSDISEKCTGSIFMSEDMQSNTVVGISNTPLTTFKVDE